jgi:GTP-binding protein LepA
MSISSAHIRNFCIIAHIDHGKSTLADRMLEITQTVSAREMTEQFLDSISLERERGITIKAKAVRMEYRGHTLNLIDTPGHADFSYEVSRSLAACEGAILLVDATQGVQAQTVAHATRAIEAGLHIVPAINKIDLDSARPEEVLAEIESSLGIPPREVLRASAKTGVGVPELLDAVLERVPPPSGRPDAPLRALIFDSVYNEYRGVIVFVRVFDGVMRAGDAIRLARAGREYEVEEVGVFRPRMEPVGELAAGEVGYVVAGIRALQDVRVGETILRADDRESTPMPGYREPQPVVFCSFYPVGDTTYEDLGRALQRLSLNDASFTFQPETSSALGMGYRCGFLGLLHMDILQERLRREQNVTVIKCAPSVEYELVVRRGGERVVERHANPARLPEEHLIEEWHEPYVRVRMVFPSEALGAVMQLCQDRRGIYVRTEYLTPERVLLTYELPFPEMMYDFYDRFKSVTRGYGSFDYEWIGYFPEDLVRLRILVAGEEIDALSTVVHRSRAEAIGRRTIEILRREIPRQLFQVALQAAVGSRVIARADIRPIAKNVLAKCYGGDVTRKRKLLEKQREGKKRMKMVGRVEIPQEAFLAVLRAGSAED